MMELEPKFSVIFAMLLFLADDIKVTFGNHLLKIRSLFATGRGFFIFPTECETIMTGFFFTLFAFLIISSIIIL
jgi:hypothetical protein